jgi:hypothetical protein
MEFQGNNKINICPPYFVLDKGSTLLLRWSPSEAIERHAPGFAWTEQAKVQAQSNSACHTDAHASEKTNGIDTTNHGTAKPHLAGKPTLGKLLL